ncbi:MAG: hypothetical protein K0V04_27105 [Deltaproteobacteria bacterium]|nr:hypothetical protein [Deltaproteobacteria bacterium]
MSAYLPSFEGVAVVAPLLRWERMSIRRTIDATLRNKLGLGHVTWPTFGMKVEIGDAARDGRRGFQFSGEGNLATRYGLDLSRYQDVEEAPPIEVEFEDDVERSGSLTAAFREPSTSAGVQLRFRSARAFYLCVPTARVHYIRDVASFVADITAKADRRGDRLQLRERIVYKTIVADSEGVLLLSKSASASARITAHSGGSGKAKLQLHDQRGDIVQMRVSAAQSAVFAFSVFRRALGRRRYVIDPQG